MRMESRRTKRMARSHKKIPKMNLTSLMDVFTILVFFLLTNSASNEALEAPKEIDLPTSIVETKPKETVVVLVTPESILVQGTLVASTLDVIQSDAIVVESIKKELLIQRSKAFAADTIELPEVNVLADRKIPFSLLKKIMSSCTSAGYDNISLAVIQKAAKGS